MIPYLMFFSVEIKTLPKNNSGRDVMIDSPSGVDDAQLKDLGLELKKGSE